MYRLMSLTCSAGNQPTHWQLEVSRCFPRSRLDLWGSLQHKRSVIKYSFEFWGPCLVVTFHRGGERFRTLVLNRKIFILGIKIALLYLIIFTFILGYYSRRGKVKQSNTHLTPHSYGHKFFVPDFCPIYFRINLSNSACMDFKKGHPNDSSTKTNHFMVRWCLLTKSVSRKICKIPREL